MARRVDQAGGELDADAGGILGEISWRGPFFGVVALMAIAFIAVMVLLRDHRSLSRYSYILGLLGLILQATKPKLNQVRTVTSHNKPVGHQEPDWTYNQATLSGDVYENLSDSQLRALNIEPSRVAHLRPARGEERAVEGSVSRPVAAPTEREDVEVVTVEPRGKHSRI